MRRKHLFSVPFAAAAWLLILVATAAASSEPIGRVVEQTGKVFLVRDGEVTALKPGVAVSDADRVVTSSDGKVLIQFHDSSLCAVGPGSEVLLADLAAPTGGLI